MAKICTRAIYTGTLGLLQLSMYDVHHFDLTTSEQADLMNTLELLLYLFSTNYSEKEETNGN